MVTTIKIIMHISRRSDGSVIYIITSFILLIPQRGSQALKSPMTIKEVVPLNDATAKVAKKKVGQHKPNIT